MSELTLPGASHPHHAPSRPKLDTRTKPVTVVLFFGALALGLGFTAFSIYSDMSDGSTPVANWAPFLLLGVALMIALCF
jgi:PiT family inorganic phosphate transporter